MFTRANPEQKRDIWCRGINLRPDTINDEERSVDAVLSTESRVGVYDFEREESIDEVLLVSGAKFPEQIPLLDNHNRSTVSAVLGSIRNIREVNGEIHCRLYFLKDDPAATRAWQLVKEGHQKDISAGYRPERYTDIARGDTKTVLGRSYTAGNRRLRITTSYRIREGSLVPIGADQAAKIRADDGCAPTTEIVMKPELKAYLVSLGLRADATDEQAEGFRAALGDEHTTRALAIEEGKETFPAKQKKEPEDQQRGSAPVAGGPSFPKGNVDHTDAIRAERDRIEGIRKLATADTNPEIIQRAISDGISVADAGLLILRAERDSAPKPASSFSHHTRGVSKEVNKQVLAAGLMHRSGARMVDPRAPEHVRKEQERLAEMGERFRGLSLPDMARIAAQMDGARDPETGMEPFTRDEFIRAGLSTPTLSYAFTTNVNAVVVGSYEEAGDTTDWVETVDVSDFRENEDISLGKQAGLELLPRGKTATHATFADEHETYSVRRFAKQFAVDEQDMIDDRLGVFQEVLPEMGRAAARLRPDFVYYLLLANPQLVVDGTAVFDDAAHANLNANVFQASALKTGITRMKKQKQDGVNLNIVAKYLVVPPTLEWTARELLNSAQIVIAGTAGSVTERGSKNVLMDSGLQLRCDARIENGVTDPLTGTAANGSASAWFLFSAPRKTIRVAYLAGSGRRPTIRQYTFDKGRYGIGWDIKMDIGAKFMGYRGCYKGNS